MNTESNTLTLTTFIKITDKEAKSGCARNIKLPDMVGPIQITIPAGTKDDTIIRYQGIKCLNKNQETIPGDLYVTINVAPDKKINNGTWKDMQGTEYESVLGNAQKNADAVKAKKQAAKQAKTVSQKQTIKQAKTVSQNTSAPKKPWSKKKKIIFIAVGIVVLVIIVFSLIGSISNSKTTKKTVSKSNKTNTVSNNTTTNNNSYYSDDDSFYIEYNLGGDVYTFNDEITYNQFLIWIEEINNGQTDKNFDEWNEEKNGGQNKGNDNTQNKSNENPLSESDFRNSITACKWVSPDRYTDQDPNILWMEFSSDGYVFYSNSAEGSYDTDKYSLEGNHLYFVYSSVDPCTVSMTTNTLTLTSMENGEAHTYYSTNVLPASVPPECNENIPINGVLHFTAKSGDVLEECNYLGMDVLPSGHYSATYEIVTSRFDGTYSGKDTYQVRTWEVVCMHLTAADKWIIWKLTATESQTRVMD